MPLMVGREACSSFFLRSGSCQSFVGGGGGTFFQVQVAPCHGATMGSAAEIASEVLRPAYLRGFASSCGVELGSITPCKAALNDGCRCGGDDRH